MRNLLTIVSEAVNPGLRVGLVTLNRRNVMGFTVIIPSEEFNKIDIVAVGNDSVPASSVQMIIREVDPLQSKSITVTTKEKKGEDWRTFLLYESGP